MWTGTVGLVNGQYKYLTAETFGHKVNANGAGLKKKQQWTIEPFPLAGASTNGSSNGNFEDGTELEYVAIKSHLNCYLAVDSFGNVTCESTERSDGARFTITICSMSNGQSAESIYWAFRNVQRGYYLGATADGMMTCTAKMPQTRAELWHIHLIPARGAAMFALKSIGRKRYARAVPANQQVGNLAGEDSKFEQIQVDGTTPWGSETLFQFKYYEGGRYALLTSSCKYLNCDGSCVDWTPLMQNGVANGGSTPIKSAAAGNSLPPVECLFTIEYHGGYIAFRDFNGRYLAGAGRSSILRTRSNNVSKDELFEFEKSPIQFSLRAAFNNKWVSVKQGVDLSANQNEVTSLHEMYQLKYDSEHSTWNISTKDGNYWALGAASTLQASSKDEKGRGHFKLKWNADGTCSILASSDGKTSEDAMKWICNRKSGQLYVGSQDPVHFYIMFQNRKSFNLRAATGSGFVGIKTLGAGKLESNKTTADSILVEYANSENNDESAFNCCYFKMPANNKYWSVIDGNVVACDAASPTCAQQWIVELRSDIYVAIRMFDSGSYLTLTNQGAIQVTACEPKNATLWEY